MAYQYKWNAIRMDIKDGAVVNVQEMSGEETELKTLCTLNRAQNTDGFLFAVTIENYGDDLGLVVYVGDAEGTPYSVYVQTGWAYFLPTQGFFFIQTKVKAETAPPG